MGQIAILDQNMVNMIAAGEVIERPASVVKELMENSIDGGATKITVSVEDGGRRLIAVTDNGCGMDSEDLAMAFEPHATSKVKTSSHLHHISTLGFRGEALASIAAVSQVRAVSRTKENLAGSRIEIDCGSKGEPVPCSADSGTSIEVRDLFYKLPARRKFLKTANTEMGHITETFSRIALASPQLDMTLIHNNKLIYNLPQGRTLRERIAELFSSYIAENLIETESSEKGLDIYALIGRPEISKTAQLQYIFLNGRFIRDKFIYHAVREAYRGMIEPNRFPVVFLFIRMPFEDVDVNVHPTKTEVRFYNANLVHSQVLSCVREKLLATELEPSVRLPSAVSDTSRIDESRYPAADGFQGRQITDAMADFFKKHFQSASSHQLELDMPVGAKGYEPASRKYAAEGRFTAGPQPKFLQVHDSFIIAETDDGFIIIDQHALHERIMYDKLNRRIKEGRLESQKLLIPVSFNLTDSQAEVLKSNSALIEQLGIELVAFGPRTVAVQSFPTVLEKVKIADFAVDLIDLLADASRQAFDCDRVLEQVLNMAACKAAIKAGQRLSNSEIEQLLAEKETTPLSERCPHGRPTTIRFSRTELEKQFKRT